MNRKYYLSISTGLLITAFILSALLTLAYLGAGSLSALSGSNFKAGRIIDDSVFYDGDSMTASQIQSFLNDMVNDSDQKPDGINGVCDTNGSKPSEFGGGTRAQYAASNPNDSVHNPPYICLNQYYENTTSHANNLRGNPVPAGAKSAAQIIHDVALSQDINPRVLLVLLQKEQILTTDDWPVEIQYRSATGYGCPDTAPCNEEYYGFYNQVYRAAYQFNLYKNNPNSYSHRLFQTNNISYQANSPSCGTKSVYIENYATAGLYNYTPYTPNAAALNNLYGLGDSCSAYGNRNFWRYYSDWFGSTFGNGYAINESNLPFGVIYIEDLHWIRVVVTNDSGVTWYSDTNLPPGEKATRLVTLGYESIPFADNTDSAWIGTNSNQIRMVEEEVAHGEQATFLARLKGIETIGVSSDASLNVAVNGGGSYKYQGLQINLRSPDKYYSYDVVSVTRPPLSLRPGASWGVTVKVKNNGNRSWYSDNSLSSEAKTRLVTQGYRKSPYRYPGDASWLGNDNQIMLEESQIDPGDTGTFSFAFAAPYSETDFTHSFGVIRDGVGKVNGDLISLRQITPRPVHDYRYISATNPLSIMTPGSSSSARIVVMNTGNTLWRSESHKLGFIGSTRLITAKHNYRSSPFSVNSLNWMGTSTQIRMNESFVAPGQTASFDFDWNAPTEPGLYEEPLTIAIDGIKVLPSIGMQFSTTVSN